MRPCVGGAESETGTGSGVRDGGRNDDGEDSIPFYDGKQRGETRASREIKAGC